MIPYETAERIRLKKAQYCRFLDTKQWDSFGKLALPEARFVFYSVDDKVLHDFSSTKALVGPTARLLKNARTSHRVSNSELFRIRESEINAIWAMEDLLVFPPAGNEPGSVMRGYGHYHEIWVKQSDDWFLKHLELRRQIMNTSYFGRSTEATAEISVGA
jgi:hypothetical protein